MMLRDIELTAAERRSDNHSAAARRQWAKPEFRARQAAIRKAAWAAGKYDGQRGHRKPSRLSGHITQIRELYGAGVPRSVIAARLGCTYGAVWSWTRTCRTRPYP